jgi:hypothetical protein
MNQGKRVINIDQRSLDNLAFLLAVVEGHDPARFGLLTGIRRRMGEEGICPA